MKKSSSKIASKCLICAFFVSLFIFILTDSLAIGLSYGVLGATIPAFINKKSLERRAKAIHHAWPEIIDNLITGINSGMTLTHSLIQLGYRGPLIVREQFLEFEENISQGIPFEDSLAQLSHTFSDPLADQVLTVVEFSYSVGSRDTISTLRNLGVMVRNDLAIRGELESKQGWIKNSAAIAALAPWLLLLMLTLQGDVAHLYATSMGISILISGLVLTCIAYIWMQKVGMLPTPPRVFLSRSEIL